MASLLLALMIVPRTDEASIGGRTVAAVFKQFRTAIHEILLDRRVLLTSNMEGVFGAPRVTFHCTCVSVTLPLPSGRMANVGPARPEQQ